MVVEVLAVELLPVVRALKQVQPQLFVSAWRRPHV